MGDNLRAILGRIFKSKSVTPTPWNKKCQCQLHPSPLRISTVEVCLVNYQISENCCIDSQSPFWLCRRLGVGLTLKSLSIPGYQFLHTPREGGHGGVGLLIKDDISLERCISPESRLNHQSYEGKFIKIPLSRETLTLGTMYRPPGKNLTDFNNDTENLLSQISGKIEK